MTKTCPHCKETKPISEFSKGTAKYGRSSWCKICTRAASSESYKRIPRERKREQERRYDRNNAEKRREKCRRYSREHRLMIQCKVWAKTLPLSWKEIETFYYTQRKAQGNRCAICGVHEDDLNHRLVFDHNHTTLKLRGLLCRSCNAGIGNLRDNPDLCLRAGAYLQAHLNNL